MKEVVEVRIRHEGDNRSWADIPPLSECLIDLAEGSNELNSLLRSCFDYAERWGRTAVRELRWNRRGSLQGHYWDADKLRARFC